ncbi:MAG: CoA-binding protein [Candidatus Heimdallarchaeaceae archaeon]|jgi:acetyltransferase
MVDQFFFPKTIAVIGASDDPMKFGNTVTVNLLENDNLQSRIFLVNPKAKTILGMKSYPSILNIEQEIDLAIIVIPAKTVPQIVDQCIEKKIKRIIIISAGFGEINEEGKKIEQEIASRAKEEESLVLIVLVL